MGNKSSNTITVERLKDMAKIIASLPTELQKKKIKTDVFAKIKESRQ